MNRFRRHAASRHWVRWLLVLLACLVLPFSTSVSLAYRPKMHHAEDCPMPHENQGTPTILIVPAPPAPPIVVPTVAAPERFEPPLSQAAVSGGAPRVLRNRDPPLLHVNDPRS